MTLQVEMARSHDAPSAIVSLAGTLLWTVLTALAGARRAPLGVIELLLLFAVLVIAPLGLTLMEFLGSSGFRAARWLQPFAAISVAVSVLSPPGTTAAALVLPWLILGLLTAVSGTRNLLQNKNRSLISLLIAISGADLALASAWLVISRLGSRPLGFQEPIILLTAVHFHYSGFATALIAACMLRRAEACGMHVRGLRGTVLLIVYLPFVVAAGFTFSAALRTVAAIALAMSVTALAAIQLWLSSRVHVHEARTFLRLASAAVLVGMALACLYEISDQSGRNWLTIPAMASTHGVLNGLGFVLLSLLGWLMERHSEESESLQVSEDTDEDRKHRRHGLRWSPSGIGAAAAGTSSGSYRARDGSPRPHYPEFLAREFYDR